MKTRRALQIIVGVLSLLVVACLLAAGICVALVLLFPDFAASISGIYDKLSAGFETVANTIGLSSMAYLVPVLAGGLPCALLLLGAVLLFLPEKGKQGKNVAGIVLSLIGIAILTVFTLVFATDLVAAFDAVSFGPLSFAWLVRIVAGGLLAVFIIFIGSALGVKVQDEVAATEQEEVVVSETEGEAVTVETVNSQVQEQPAHTTDTVEYVPTHASVSEVADNTYGTEKQLSPEVVAKINKARLLYDMGAITRSEYTKLVETYTKK